MMTYKGYHGTVTFDEDAETSHGEVTDLRDVVTFQGRSVDELKAAFHESIDDYLDFCAERGEEPDRPYSGNFVLRIDPQLHRKLAALSQEEGSSLNRWVESKLSTLANQRG
jgi:predicted HicB family RNase H-like nuclease